MPLRLLLDENISPVVVDQGRRHYPEMDIDSVFRWRDGAYANKKDELLVLAAATEGWTLVTYDRKTIPPLLNELIERGESHAGMIYVDRLTIDSRDFGLLIDALIDLWKSEKDCNWRDRIYHLKRPKR